MSGARLFELELPPIMEAEPRSYVMAATAWRSNADLIFDCARLGFLRHEWLTLDATYGRGKWWELWSPDQLETNDLNEATGAEYHHDFRDLPFHSGMFDAVTYDPPYIAPGGRATSTLEDFNDRFGLHSTPAKPDGLQEYINDGLTECARVTAHRGFVLVKCKNYVNGATLWPGTFLTWQHAQSLGLELVNEMVHLSGTGPQSQTTQEHARSNYSSLLVFKMVARNE